MTPPITSEFFRSVEWQADLSGIELAIYLGERGWTYACASQVAPEAICARVMPAQYRRVA